MNKILATSLVGLLFTVVAVAPVPFTSSGYAAAAEEEEELPGSGTLASTQGGAGAQSAAGVWGGTDAQGAKLPPIGGSVFRVKDRTWKMRLFNNSKDPYSTTVEVLQFGSNGSIVKRDTYSYTLRPGEKREQDFTATTTTIDAQLNLTRWKNLNKKAGQEKGAAAKGEK